MWACSLFLSLYHLSTKQLYNNFFKKRQNRRYYHFKFFKLSIIGFSRLSITVLIQLASWQCGIFNTDSFQLLKMSSNKTITTEHQHWYHLLLNFKQWYSTRYFLTYIFEYENYRQLIEFPFDRYSFCCQLQLSNYPKETANVLTVYT